MNWTVVCSKWIYSISGLINHISTNMILVKFMYLHNYNRLEELEGNLSFTHILSSSLIQSFSFCIRSGRSNVIEKLEALELEHAERMEVEETSRSGVRQGRSEMRRFQREVMNTW